MQSTIHLQIKQSKRLFHIFLHFAMSQKRKQSKSYSKKKSSYAPIMLTSKAIKPIQRDQNSQFYNPSQTSGSHKFRTKISKFMRISQNQSSAKQKQQQNNSEVERLNFTQKTLKKIRENQLEINLSHSCKKARLVEVTASQMIINSHKQSLEEIYFKTRNIDPQLQNFSMRQPSTSAVVKVQFNEQNKQKFIRKNNANSIRYNSLLGNSAPNSNRQYKSASTNSNIQSHEGNYVRQGEQEVLIQISDQKSFKLVSTTSKTFKNNHPNYLNHNKTFDGLLYLKDPNKKMMYSHKHKPLDLTFTNFKQKVYQKKLSKLSNQRTKYNQEWNQYLNKYYLNIKKVKPLLKYEETLTKNQQILLIPQNYLTQSGNFCVDQEKHRARQSKSSAEAILNQLMLSGQMGNNNFKADGSKNEKNLLRFDIQSQRNQRLRSSTLMTSSKTTSALQSSNLSPPNSPKRSHKMYNDAHQSKIQSDIIAKRLCSNKKDYFVFSMGDSSNQNKTQNPTTLKFNAYKDLLWKVNFSNSLYVKLPDEIQKPYKFFVGKGNNSSIIKGIMRRRFWWQLVDKITPDVNFVWTQLRVNDFVKSQAKRRHEQIKLLLEVNHHEYQPQFNQEGTNQTFKQNCQLNKKIFKGNDLTLWLSHFKDNSKHQLKYLEESSINILQKRLKSIIKRKKLTFIDSTLTLLQKSHNHFQSNYFIGNKKALFYAMRKYYKLYGKNPFDYIPLTFHISGGLQDPQFNQFLQKYNQILNQKMKNKNSDIKNIWIVKPGEVTNRGRGITVCATLDQIKIRIKSKQKNSDGSLRTYILQKYIQKPLLYQKRKFDIRHYMLMTCINGSIKGYWYQEGYIRTTSTQYSIRNCKDLYTHLTNDAIQKNSSDYGKYQKGNKISYEQFQKYLTKNYRKDFDFFEQILPQMKKLATDAVRATYSIIQPNRRQNNFELFGLDFMLDQNMKVYLIQCNTNPCLELSCPLLAKIISGLIQNVFKICVDPIFPPPFEWPNSKKFQMGDNSLNELKFQLTFDEVADGRELEKLYSVEKGFSNKIGKVQEEQQQYEDEEQQQWNDESNA